MHVLAVSMDNWIGAATAIAVGLSILYQRKSEQDTKRRQGELKEGIKENTEITHKVEKKVNGVLLAHLELIAELTQELSTLTGSDEYKARAKQAKDNLIAHLKVIGVFR